MNGWEFPASYGELMAALHASSYLNVHSESKVFLPMPWPDEARAEVVTPEEHERLKKQLLRHSAFAS